MPHAQPILTDLPLKGLTAPFTILQITDLHACATTEEEAVAMPRGRYDYIQPRIGLFSEGRPYPPEAVLPVLGDYAREVGADLILMTGDIIDFPSEANFALLEQFIASSAVPVLYITGNHDWSYADDYHTPHATAVHLPRVSALAGARDGVAVRETPHIVFIAVDNSLDRISAASAEAYATAVTDARAKGKTVILTMHIPFRVDTLVEDCTRVWRRDIFIGEGACGAEDASTMSMFRAVTEGSELAPDAVIVGHLHFNHEDVFPNGVPQLITDISSGGRCRLIRLLPA